MKLHIVISAVLFLINDSITAQIPLFNKLYPNNYLITTIKTLPNNSYIATFNYSQTPLSYTIKTLDSTGNIMTSVPIPARANSSGDMGLEYNSISNERQGRYIIAAISDKGVVNTDLTGELICYDYRTNSIVWQQSQQYHNDSTTLYFKSSWLPSGDIAAAGEVSFYNPAIHAGNSRIILVRTDSLGNKRWEKDFVQQAGYNMYLGGLAVTPDGGFVLGCTSLWYQGYDNIDGNTASAVLIKTDANGNEQWRKVWGSPNLYDGSVGLMAMSDGSVVSISTKGTSIPPNWDTYAPIGKFDLRKWSMQGTLLATKYIARDTGLIVRSNLLLRPNGNIGVGFSRYHGFSTRFLEYGYLEITPNLDSARLRYYPSHYNPTAYRDQLTIGSIDNTPDGGIICAGTHYCTGGCTVFGGNQAWIMKLDSAGCEIDNCWVGTVAEQSAVNSQQVFVFPNPANTQITVATPLQKGSIYLYNALGQLTYQQIITTTHTQIEIYDIPNGLYFISVYDANGQLSGSERVVVQHE